MQNGFKLLQLTNYAIGAVPTGQYIPVGTMTREVQTGSVCEETFSVTTSENDTVYINEAGVYQIQYTGYLTVATAGTVAVQLQINGVTYATATVTTPATGTYPITLSFVTRALSQCCANVNSKLLIRLLNSGEALTGGECNLVIEKLY